MLSKNPTAKPASTDIIQRSIGGFGKYHYWLCFLIFLNKIATGQQPMAIIFLAPPVSYTCGGEKNKCPCDDPVFDTSKFTSTIVTEWKLICEKKTLVSLAQMLIQFGILIGSLIFGMAADRFGRRNPLIGAVVLHLVAGLGATYAPSYWIFNLFRFHIGAAIGGFMVIGFVILMEYIGVKYRATVAALYQAPFNLGTLSLPLISYYFRDFRDYHLALILPIFFLLGYICVLPESPRWLLAVNKNDAAIKILTKVAKINRLPTDNIRQNVLAHQATIDPKALRKGTIADLFRTPNLRKHALAMSLQWFTCSYCFYGVAQYISHFTEDIFINVTASMTLAFAGTFVTTAIIPFVGRKPMLLSGQGVCAVCFFLLAFLPRKHLASVILASIGVLAAFMVFILVYLYCSELFPTMVRSAALGFSSMMARVGSMIAPFVIDTKDYGDWVPAAIFAAVPALSVIIALVLPETKGRELMTTLQEGEALGKKLNKKPKNSIP